MSQRWGQLDGGIPAQYGPYMLQEVVERIAIGARRAGRSPQNVTLAPVALCCVCADRGVVLRSVRQQLAFYAQMPSVECMQP